MAETISKTVAGAIPVPENAMTKSLERIIAALEVREERLLARIEEALGEDEGRVFDLARNDGYLGT